MPIKGTGLTLPGLKSEFFDRLSQVSTIYQDLTTRIGSNKKKETYGFLGSVPPMREWGTGRKAQGMFTETYDVENEKYECTLEVDRDEIDDDQTGQIRLRTRQLADRAAGHKDSCLASLMVNGPSANYLAYDGQIFFSAAHESGKSGAQTNLATPAAVDADAPTAAEFRTALGAGIAQMLGLLDDQGEPMSVDASGLVCVVPPSMYLAALEAVNATVMSSTTNVMAGAARVVAFSRLTTASVFYLLKTNVAVRPFIFQERDPIEFRAKEGESDEGFMREKYFYGVRARYKLTYGYWQHAIHNTFTE